jgi:hypothetical protein
LLVKPKSKQSYEFQDGKITKVSPQSSDNLGNPEAIEKAKFILDAKEH